MTNPRSSRGDLFIGDNSDSKCRVGQHLVERCESASFLDVPTAYSGIGTWMDGLDPNGV